VRKRGAAVTGVAHLLKHADGLSWRIELGRVPINPSALPPSTRQQKSKGCPSRAGNCDDVAGVVENYSCTPLAAIRRVPTPYFLMFSLTNAPAGPCHHFCSASMLSN
jgi:hypothetical protein